MKRKEKVPEGSVEVEDGRQDRLPVGEDPGEMEKTLFAGEEGSSAGEGPAGVKEKSRTSRRLIVQLCAVLLCLLLVAVGLHWIKSKRSGSSSPATIAVASATRIIRPVPQPDYREMLDFLLIYPVQGREMITALRMEAVFHSLANYRNFKKRTVVFRDAVYDFLLRQDAADNTQRTWQAVFSNNLLAYLRIDLPRSCPDRIRLTQIENL